MTSDSIGIWFDSMMAYLRNDIFAMDFMPDPHPSATENAERRREKMEQFFGHDSQEIPKP